MHEKDRHAAVLVWPIDGNLTVEPARAQKRWVQYLGPVRCGQEDNAHARIEPVQFAQQLIATNSEPVIEKNGTPASPATARASSVLPVPGGPTRRIPLGMRAPRRP